MKCLSVLGYPVHVDSPQGLVQAMLAGLDKGEHQHVITLNPEMLMRGESDPIFASLLKSGDIVLPDGAGIVWALRHKGFPVTRVPGIEFSQKLLDRAASSGESVALIGASPEVNEAAQENLLAQYPGLKIAYAHHGFFQSVEERRSVAETCARMKPKYVFAALGVPGQELWIQEFKTLFTEPTIFVGVGGSFDIWSGLKRRAHPLFLKLNLEWLYRITSEPLRLKRVYKTLPMFVVKVLLEKVRPETKDEYPHAESNL